MIDRLRLLAEERLGVKAEDHHLERFQAYLLETYGPGWEDFRLGEAAAFLTVNETYFFREADHFAFVRELLPSFAGGINICSAATASGCEAYSIAALLENYNRANKPFGRRLSYHIDAFDINPRVIETAEEGRYSPRAFRDDGAVFRPLLDPYIQEQDGAYKVDPSLKKNIRFFIHNILDPLGASYDLVFFRNAFIYFSPRSRERVLSNLASSLAEGGFLVAGVSETAAVRHPLLAEHSRGDVFYFRKAGRRHGDGPAVSP